MDPDPNTRLQRVLDRIAGFPVAGVSDPLALNISLRDLGKIRTSQPPPRNRLSFLSRLRGSRSRTTTNDRRALEAGSRLPPATARVVPRRGAGPDPPSSRNTVRSRLERGDEATGVRSRSFSDAKRNRFLVQGIGKPHAVDRVILIPRSLDDVRFCYGAVQLRKQGAEAVGVRRKPSWRSRSCISASDGTLSGGSISRAILRSFSTAMPSCPQLPTFVGSSIRRCEPSLTAFVNLAIQRIIGYFFLYFSSRDSRKPGSIQTTVASPSSSCVSRSGSAFSNNSSKLAAILEKASFPSNSWSTK